MVAVDTNIIVRFLTRDDIEQYKKAYLLFQQEDIFIPHTVILETEWVLRYAYQFKPDAICQAFKKLLGLKNVYMHQAGLIAQAIELHQQGMDFADALHLLHCEDQQAFYTFDKKFCAKSKLFKQNWVKIP